MDSMDQGGIKWGAEIAVDRPKWLTDQDIAWVKWREGGWSGFNKGTSVRHLRHSEWLAFRLPADHPHYQKQAFEQIGTIASSEYLKAQKRENERLTNYIDNLRGEGQQTPEPKKAIVDWSKPIEAVHESGEVRSAIASLLNGSRVAHINGIGNNWYVQGNEVGGTKWTIRNVQTPEPTAAIDPALVERMRKLVQNMAQADKREVAIMGTGQREAYEEARGILKALEPVDPDEEAAEEIRMRYAKGDGGSFTQTIVAAIRRGRALERGG